MGNNLSLIHLPAQSGKTRKMIELMKEWKRKKEEERYCHEWGNESDDKGDGIVNFIFTTNTKLLAKQTHKRISESYDDIVPDESDEGSIYTDDDSLYTEHSKKQFIGKSYAWISGEGAINEGELYADLLDNKYDTVICCSNSSRVTHVFFIIDTIVQ